MKKQKIYLVVYNYLCEHRIDSAWAKKILAKKRLKEVKEEAKKEWASEKEIMKDELNCFSIEELELNPVNIRSFYHRRRF